MNNLSSSMFSLGKSAYTKSYEKTIVTKHIVNKPCIDSSAHINKKKAIAIGKPMQTSTNFSSHYHNNNDVIRAKRSARAGGTVAPAKSNIKR